MIRQREISQNRAIFPATLNFLMRETVFVSTFENRFILFGKIH